MARVVIYQQRCKSWKGQEHQRDNEVSTVHIVRHTLKALRALVSDWLTAAMRILPRN